MFDCVRVKSAITDTTGALWRPGGFLRSFNSRRSDQFTSDDSPGAVFLIWAADDQLRLMVKKNVDITEYHLNTHLCYNKSSPKYSQIIDKICPYCFACWWLTNHIQKPKNSLGVTFGNFRYIPKNSQWILSWSYAPHPCWFNHHVATIYTCWCWVFYF